MPGHRRRSSLRAHHHASKLALPAAGSIVISAAMFGSVVTPGNAGASQLHETASIATTQLPIVGQQYGVTPSSAQQKSLDADMKAKVKGKMRVVRDTAIRTDSKRTASAVSTAQKGSTLPITAVSDGNWTQIAHGKKLQWVASGDLAAPKKAKVDNVDDLKLTVAKSEDNSDDKPGDGSKDDSDSNSDAGGSGKKTGTSMKKCSSGSDVESGLKQDTIRVHRSVCAKFPGVSSYGGTGGGGEHATGKAIDIMLGSADGDQIAKYVRSHAKELGVSQVIWNQRIWTVQRSSEGWRSMPDRGGKTANHKDHVHVTTYGDRGTKG